MKTTCAKPTTVYHILGKTTASGKKLIVNGSTPKSVKYKLLLRDCGQCKGCKLRRRMDLALRLEHESKYHDYAWFVTATYSDEHLPYGGSLHAEHQSRFIKTLREKFKRAGIDTPLRFFSIGEYGDDYNRPHYHFIIFGPDFPDKKVKYTTNESKFYSNELESLLGTQSGTKYYNSDFLTQAWGKGHIQLTGVSSATMQYVAKYHVEKITGERAEEHYSRFIEGRDEPFIVESETSRMSTHPGLGKKWIEQYWRDVYPDGYLTLIDGQKCAPPKYYDKWLEKHHPKMYEQVKKRREENIDLEMLISKRREDMDKCRDAKISINKQMRASR